MTATRRVAEIPELQRNRALPAILRAGRYREYQPKLGAQCRRLAVGLNVRQDRGDAFELSSALGFMTHAVAIRKVHQLSNEDGFIRRIVKPLRAHFDVALA